MATQIELRNTWITDILDEANITQTEPLYALATSGLLDAIANRWLMITRLLQEIAVDTEILAPQLEAKLLEVAQAADVTAFMDNWNALPEFARTLSTSVGNTVGIEYAQANE